MLILKFEPVLNEKRHLMIKEILLSVVRFHSNCVTIICNLSLESDIVSSDIPPTTKLGKLLIITTKIIKLHSYWTSLFIGQIYCESAC